MEVDFQMESTKLTTVRAETRLMALKAAKDKAAAMAGELGGTLGPVLRIDEYQPGESRSVSIASNASFISSSLAPDQRSETFIPGAINVQVTV